MSALRLLYLRPLAAVLDAYALILDAVVANSYTAAHKMQARFERVHERRRRVWMRIAQITPAHKLLRDVPPSKVMR